MTKVLVRADGLDVNEVPDGYVVYQIGRDRVHYLNKTAAIVFEFCDGGRGADEIIDRVSQLLGVDNTTHHEIAACIESLVNEELVLSRTR
jgi:hypothetical protein